MRAKLTKPLKFGHRTLNEGRTLTITNERYQELLRAGYFGERIIEPITKQEPFVKKQIGKDEEE